MKMQYWIAIGVTAAIIVIVAAFKKEVADNLKMIAELIIAIYAISYGVWQGKKYLEGKKEKKDEPVE